ncbi:5-formyltetrahydrofolate cyclo-ligase [candidate division KSB1 bacterium]|nr:5-formyltetrahydrofolate cyclo-ligase [candidate division KSB1 bacterium]
MRNLRRSLTPEFRAYASAVILQRLTGLDCYRRARAIHSYVAWQEEVENHTLFRAMLREGKRVVAPKINSQTRTLEHYLIPYFEALAPGAFGILEPSSARGACVLSNLEELDLVLVPGLAFDREGNRLGYGGGYYDRLLAEIEAPKVALAFEVQIVDAIPAEPHDRHVNIVVTEREVISCRTD